MQVKPLAVTKETESYPGMRHQPTEEQQEISVGSKHQNSTQRHSQEESWLHSLQAAVNLLHKRHHPKRHSAEEQGDVCIMYAPLGLCVFLGDRREGCMIVAAPSALCFKSHANEFHRSRGAIDSTRKERVAVSRARQFAFCPGISHGADGLTAAQLWTDLKIKGVLCW